MPAGLHLLVVDDNLSNLRIAELILASLGHTVELAPDAATAAAYLADRKYHAVLLDCQMPVVDGYEFTRRIRAGAVSGADPRIPIIAVTAHALPDDRAKCLDSGMDDSVTKPIRVAELSAALHRQTQTPATPIVAPKAPPLDPQTLALASAQPGKEGPSLLPELIRRYLAEQPRHLGLIAAAWHSQNFATLADSAHALAAEAATVGATDIRHSALLLERAGRRQDDAAIEAYWRELCAAAAALRPALAELDLLPR